MEYDFDEIIPRRNTDSVKWDAAPDEGVLPLWVADMDFKVAPVITAALQSRVAHGVFGYTQTPQRFYDAIINWWQRRHGVTIGQKWIIPVTGIIPALSAAIRALISKGDKVLIQPPVYNHFYTTLANCGCSIVENNLLYNNGHYTPDFEDMEIKAADPEVKLFLLCNPHNPAGRAWKLDELQRIAAICKKHNVIVLSDEIHSDLVFGSSKHIPFALIESTNCITFSSPGKAFNLAGLQVGYVFTQDSVLRTKLKAMLTLQEIELLSPFAIEALIAAYNNGEEWLEALKHYLYNNYKYLQEFVALHLPQIVVVPLQATYLVWLDCRALNLPSETLAKKLLQDQKLWVNAGTMYGAVGEGFLRINIACALPLLKEGLQRIKNELGN